MSRHALLIVFAAVSALAQTASSPHFEAATIKAVGPEVRMGYREDGQMEITDRLPLTDHIASAYGVESFQVQGPAWLATEFYAITAKRPDGPAPTREQDRQMLANLLTERFALVVRRITKEVPGYELVVAPGGPGAKLAASVETPRSPTVAGPPERPAVDPDGFPVLNENQIWSSRIADGKQRFTFGHRTMAAFASDLRLNWQMGPERAVIPIVDKTGLTGPLDFHLEIPAGSTPLSPDSDDPPVGPKEVSAALEKQLGLKLNPVKVPLDYIVVDKMNKVPTEN